MELEHMFVILLFFLHCELSVLPHPIITATFRVLHQHPGIKSCAAAVLQQNNLLGGRVSNVTGVCEGLSYPWGLNQTIESGYSYVKKISVQQKYQPPVKVGRNYTTWRIPGILSPESKVDMTVTLPSSVQNSPWLSIYFDTSKTPCMKFVDCQRIMVNMWILDSKRDPVLTLDFYEVHAEQIVENNILAEMKLQQQNKDAKMKFTFHVKTDVLKVLIDDRNIGTYRLQKVDPKTVRVINTKSIINKGLLHGFKFTEG